MYDQFALSSVLQQVGFINIEVKSAFASSLTDWKDYELETRNGEVFKPDSLFMEAVKPNDK